MLTAHICRNMERCRTHHHPSGRTLITWGHQSLLPVLQGPGNHDQPHGAEKVP